MWQSTRFRYKNYYIIRYNIRAAAILTFDKCLYLRGRLRLTTARRLSAYMQSSALATTTASSLSIIAFQLIFYYQQNSALSVLGLLQLHYCSLDLSMALRERFFNLRKYKRMIADLAQLHDGIHQYSSSTTTLHRTAKRSYFSVQQQQQYGSKF